ncbi:PREDICTED: uncharacterized protein LOC109172190 [Ipomoea nil]|uniref:uncharacterized protein LOC109172190 n=1 Tax=Ipomoea nil TaxID=35883 RepID=UPI0009015DC6|nr:PREDICTED: uncharacterized protein LOC109172190 [Ipomoea nil]
MSGEYRAFVAWEEKFIAEEKGSRIIHYYLKDTVGGSLLAVVGRERSIRHITYTVSGEFLDYYRCWNAPIAGTKWRARRDVVEWLISLVPRHHPSSPISDPQISESTMAAITNPGIQLADKEIVPRKLKPEVSDIAWLGEASICSKRLKHYPAIFSNGLVIAAHSFVSIMVDEESHSLGYIEDLYEDKNALKCVKIRWFHHLREVKCVIPQLDTHPREVFITPHVQAIGAECIDGPAAVLTPNDYQKYAGALPECLLSGTFLCSREFKDNKAFPFCLNKLQGYYNQAIFSMLHRQSVSQQTVEGQKKQEEKGSATKGPPTQVTKRIRDQSDQISETSLSGPGSQVTKCESTRQKLKIKISRKGPIGVQPVGPQPQPQPQSHASFKVGENIEFLCQDSAMRGCWFKCTIVQAKQRHLKVQYFDVNDVDVPGKLEEWVPASRAAAPDKLGMRCPERLTIRPWPRKESSNRSFEVGDAVDAWWCDGWWEGIVAGFDVSRSDHFEVYFPGENKSMTFPKKNLRISRDWIDNKWVDIKPKPDICSFISAAAVGSKSTISSCSTLDKASKVTAPSGDTKSLTAPKPGKDVAELDLKKRLSVNDQKEAGTGNHVGRHASGKKGKSVK